MRPDRRQAARRRLALATGVLSVVALPVSYPGVAADRPNAFARASLSASDDAVSMQSEVVPARVARVAVVTGSGGRDAWALGFSSAGLPEWGEDGAIQQVVWLHLVQGAWEISGPPRRAGGSAFNPVLSSFAIASTGEGWAVGEQGVLLHKAPSSPEWIEDRQVAQASPDVTLTSVALVEEQGRLFGWAVGTNASIYRLEAGRWTLEPSGTDLTADGRPELAAVAAASATDVWTVTGSATSSVRVYRREDGTWRRKPVGQRIFDEPPAKSDQGAGLSQAASGSAVAADSSGAWVGGQMYPASASHPTGDDSNGASSRPFTVRFPADGSRPTSYCPDQYEERQSGTLAPVDQSRLCDRPFPTSLFDISSISIVPGGDVFAGGFGLYRFHRTGWHREPDTNGYLISVSFATEDEGWVASSGSSFGAGGTIRSSATTLGHWTSRPRARLLARWPQAQDSPLESVALAADGSGRAIAVGQKTSVVVSDAGTGWDVLNRESAQAFHAVAWPAGADPWAVGENGIVYRVRGARELARDPASDLTDLSLFGVAFSSSADGVAVGAGGSILRYDGTRWREDSQSRKLTSSDLYAVIPTGDGFLAVGRDATVIERSGGVWRERADAQVAAARGETALPTLYAAALLPDSSVLVGGTDGLLVSRPRASFRRYPAPVEGTVVALAAGGSVRAPAIWAAVTPDLLKYRGDTPAVTRGALLAGDGRTWRDASLDRRVTMFTSTDPSAFQDPPVALASAPGSRAGWAVGGTAAGVRDDEGHFRSEPTSSIYRFDANADPRPPDVQAGVSFPGGGVTFALFGETWCGRGICSATAGSGTMADDVALRIREEINAASRRPGGPSFVLFTGGMRRQGFPEELAQFRGYIRGFEIPVFAAIGANDLVPGPTDAATATVDSTGVAARSRNDVWLETFGAEPQPWGAGKRLGNIRPVSSALAPDGGLARTHYAFDYVEDDRQRLRVVVVDSSTRSYGDPAQQNPRNEEQGSWLQSVLAEAQLQLRIPRIVVMNQPTFVPTATQPLNWNNAGDQFNFEGTVLGTRVTGVFTGGLRMNAITGLPRGSSEIPLYIMGGGGAPLGFDNPTELPSKRPSDGFYHAWHAVTLDVDHPNPAGQAPVSVKTFPVIDSLAIKSFQGRVLRAGYSAELIALARSLLGGISDPDQARAGYIELGTRAPRRCIRPGQGYGSCTAQSAIAPPVRFFSRTPEIADFVVPDPAAARDGSPRRDPLTDAVVRDTAGTLGFLCTFKAGVAQLSAVVGFHEARFAVQVRGGDGPCIRGVEKDLPVPEPRLEQPRPGPVLEPRSQPGGFHALTRDTATVIFPPPPPPVAAPAPPGAPGIGRKEEHEYEAETEGHREDGHRFVALEPQPRERPARAEWQSRGHRGDAPESPMMLLGGIALLAFMAAAMAATRSERPAPGQARWRR